jgi:hypothetical protein
MQTYYTHFYGNIFTQATFGAQLYDFMTGKIFFFLTPLLGVYAWRKGCKKTVFFAVTAVVAFLLYILMNGSLPQPRYFFACYFYLITYVFLTLSRLDARSAWAGPALILVLCDSRLDLTVRNAMTAVKEHATLSEAEIVRRHIPHVQVFDHVRPASAASPAYIIADGFSSSYYLPPGVRLHWAEQTHQAAFFAHCTADDVRTELPRYTYALLTRPGDSPCYDAITRRGRLLIQADGLSLYDLTALSLENKNLP